MLIGGLCFLVMLTEGAIGDWSGIYLRHNTGSELRRGRDGVHRILARHGHRATRAATSSTRGSAPRGCSAPERRWSQSRSAGVLLIGQTIPAVVGFVLCGLGIANAVPLLFSAAGRIDPPGPSLAAAFTLGYTGFIVGPPVIGVLSDQAGLPRTLALLVVALVAVTALGGRAIGRINAPRCATPKIASPR